jgi:hypothetical protein
LIGTYNQRAKAAVEECLKLHGVACPVETRDDWYFS